MKCQHCKAELSKGMKYCPRCGEKVQKQTGKRILVVILAVVLIAAAAGGTFLLNSVAKEAAAVLGTSYSMETDVFTTRPTEPAAETQTTVVMAETTKPLEKQSQIIASGSCGETMTWALTEDGTLTISGSGAMDDYDENNRAPWRNADVKVQNVVFDGEVSRIGAFAFYGMDIEEITVPASVSEIGFYALHPTGEIWVDERNHFYSSDEYGVLFNKSKSTLIAAPMKLLGAYTVPESVTRIEHGAFLCCSEMTEVNMPETVSEIGTMAFTGCLNLTFVRIPSNVNTIGTYTFSYCGSLADLSIPSDMSFEENALAYCNLENVFYEGTKQQWENLQGRYKPGNEVLFDAEIHYESY